MLDWAVSERAARNEALASKLRDLGYAVDLDALAQENPESVIGRVHIAQALMAQGVIGSISEGFDRFFGPGKPCYVPRRHFPFQSAVDVIRNSGGLAVLAHPLQYDFPADVLHTFLADAVAAGFTGLETDYGAYSPAQRLQLRQLAVQYGLLPTGGTDFHGTHRPHIALGVGTGDLAVPDALLAALARRR
jgi:predicted metal-dependent phosphoesterase TrpH